jgi:hypothetical protein
VVCCFLSSFSHTSEHLKNTRFLREHCEDWNHDHYLGVLSSHFASRSLHSLIFLMWRIALIPDMNNIAYYLIVLCQHFFFMWECILTNIQLQVKTGVCLSFFFPNIYNITSQKSCSVTTCVKHLDPWCCNLHTAFLFSSKNSITFYPRTTWGQEHQLSKIIFVSF